MTFEYKDANAINELPGVQTGMIAQEVEGVFPNWVDEGPNGYKRLTFRGFEALVVEALRELREEKDAKIASLEARLEGLERRLIAGGQERTSELLNDALAAVKP